MVTFKGLPVYRATLGSEDGVVRVSLVEDPAVQSQFDVFARGGKAPALYAVQSEEKRIVRGVVLRADWPIYRRDSLDDPGYYVTFGAEVIRKAAERYLTEGRANAVDTDHDGQEVDGVQMVQFFIKDTAAGVAPAGFDDIADGSLFAEYHITNDEVWDEVKAGTWKGFSVEIFYTLIPAVSASFCDINRQISNIIRMSKLENLKARLARIFAEFGNITTDKGVLYWDGDEDLKAGDRVFIEDADGNRSDAADGDYVTADGKTIVVVEGAVSEIRDPEAEVAPQGEGEAEQESAEKMAAQSRAAKMEESYDEKMSKIAEAISAARGNREDEGGYLINAGDDFAVWAYYSEETGWMDKYVRYTVSWAENGGANVSDPVDVRPAFVPLDFDDAAAFKGGAASEETPTEEEFEQAVKAAEDFKAENATLRARVAELEKTPAGKPAGEQYKADGPEGQQAGKTGNKGLDRLSRIMSK